MNKISSAAISTLLIASCAQAEPNDFRISDFKFGLICLNPGLDAEADKHQGVCFETEEIHVTGQGACVFNGNQRSCTWYGFEFNYENAKQDTKLDCVAESDGLGEFGDPGGIDQTDSDRYEYQIELPAGSNHYFNPQYSVFATVSPTEPKSRTHKTTCSHVGEEVFSFTQRLHYTPDSNFRSVEENKK